MKEIIIGDKDCNQRFDKYLQKYLKSASRSFIYKMLRKKNIKLNNSKADGNEILKNGDKINIYFSDETLNKFRENKNRQTYPLIKLDIIYEDEDILLVNKPVGMLSQKAREDDTTLVEYILGYLQNKGEWKENDTFKPSICNRLDRNTSGLVLAGKSLRGLQFLSEIIKERKIKKYYYAIVCGSVKKEEYIKAYLKKDKKKNKVIIKEKLDENEINEYSLIETSYRPLSKSGEYTLLEVELITGKTHQIRGHLASIGHPLLGDLKYGNFSKSDEGKKYFLHAQRLEFPELEGDFHRLSKKVFEVDPPKEFKEKYKIIKKQEEPKHEKSNFIFSERL